MLTFGNNHTQIVTNRYAFSLAESSFYRIAPFSMTYNHDLPPLARHMYNVIAGIINIDTNSGQISYEGLVLLSDMSYRTVIRMVEVLEQAGVIRVDRAPRGSKIPNIYHLQGKAADMILRLRPGMAQDPQVSETHSTTPQVSTGHTSNAPEDMSQSVEVPTSVAETHREVPEDHSIPGNRVSQRQTLKQESVEMIQENDTDVVVVENEDDIPIFKLDGVEPKTMLAWTKQYGVTRVKEVLDAVTRKKNVNHAPGWVASALKHGWEFGKARTQKPQKQAYDAVADGRRYITGPYAEFIQY